MRSRILPGLAVGFCLAITPAAAAKVPVFSNDLIQLHAADGHDIATLTTTPKGGVNTDMPAVLHLHGGPGAGPMAGSGRWIAEGLAAYGYTTIAPQMWHSKHYLNFTYEQLDGEVKAAIDHLQAMGFKQVILAGSSFGSITATRYMADTHDPRVKAVIHFSATADLDHSVPYRIGEDAFRDKVAEAGRYISQGQGDERVVSGGGFAAVARNWLDLYGPAARGVNSKMVSQVGAPVLFLLGGIDAKMRGRSLEFNETLKRNSTASPKADLIFYPGDVNHAFYPVHDKVLGDVIAWLKPLGLGPQPRNDIQVTAVNIDEGEGVERTYAGGMKYAPLKGKAGPAYIIVHDWLGDAFNGPSEWLARAVAKRGYTAVGINAVRGEIEYLRGRYKASDKSIAYWVDYLHAQGFKEVVLVGHGYGGNRINHYLSATPGAAISGVAYLAPPPDAADWLSHAAGDRYAAAVSQAEADQARGAKDTLIELSAPPPRPAHTGAPKVWIVMDPTGFMEHWGPQAPVFSRDVVGVKPPVLMLSGSNDDYLDAAAAKTLAAARPGTTVKVYPDAGHDFDGFEDKVADDLVAWGRAR